MNDALFIVLKRRDESDEVFEKELALLVAYACDRYWGTPAIAVLHLSTRNG